MSSRNPALNDSIFERETAASRGGNFSPGWGGSPADELPPGMFNQPGAAQPAWQNARQAPLPGGPVAGGDTMRLNGTLTAAAVLLGLVFVSAAFGWNAVTFTDSAPLADGTIVRSPNIPGWLPIVGLLALGTAILTAFKPKLARITGPIYAVGMGGVVGMISAIYNARWDGIVLQAVATTGAVFFVMLALYATRTIRVTDRLRSTIIAATLGIAVVYGISMLLALFKVRVPILYDASPLGILVSVVIAGIAAFNLLLDFDFIERGVKMGAPRYMEWYGAFGLMVSLIWLYMEILRLLGKLRER